MPTFHQRKAQTLRAIELAANLAGIDPRVLQVLALHESGGDYLSVHKLPADVRAAERSYQREAKRYASNPYYGDAWRWTVGRGPLGMVVADNLHFVGKDRDPLLLHDPAWAALAAVRRVVALHKVRAAKGKPTTWRNVHRSWKWGSSEGSSDAAATAESDAKWLAYLERFKLGELDGEPISPWPQAGWSLAPSSADDRTVARWHADLGELAEPNSSSAQGADSGAAAIGIGVAILAGAGILGAIAATTLRARR